MRVLNTSKGDKNKRRHRSLFRHRPLFPRLEHHKLLMRPLAQHVCDKIVLLARVVMHRRHPLGSDVLGQLPGLAQ